MQRTLTLFALSALTCVTLRAQPGTLDTSFNPGTGANGSVDDLVLQPDGKVIIVGNFTTVGGSARNRIARLNEDGSLDTGFNPAAGADDLVSAVALQSDGKVLIGGFFSTVGGTARNSIARLNADGTLDVGFNPGSGANSAVLDIVVQPDGKVLIAGFFTSVNGAARGRVARLNADGTVDTGFTTGAGASGNVLDMALQPDGKLIIGGEFTTYSGTARSGVARLNENGTLDSGFNPGTGISGTFFVDVITVALQADGKVIIAGRFDSFNGTPRFNIARLNTNGSLDTGFTAGTGETFTMATQTNGKIITGGFMFMGRLTDTGFDTDFVTGTSVDSWVYALAVQPDGKILVGGEFNSYNGTQRSKIMRVNGDAINVGLSEHGPVAIDLRLYPNPNSGGTVWMEVPQELNGKVQVEMLQTDGRVLLTASFNAGTNNDMPFIFNLEGTIPAGNYVVRIISAERVHTGRLVIQR